MTATETIEPPTSSPSNDAACYAGRFTVLHDVGYVDFRGARLWCHIVVIDNKKGEDRLSTRQIRGLGTYGLPVFTIWIKDDCKVEFLNQDGGSFVLLSNDGNSYPLYRGVIIKAVGNNGEEILLSVPCDDFRGTGVKVFEADETPFGDEADQLIEPFTGGDYYPHVTYGPKRFRSA